MEFKSLIFSFVLLMFIICGGIIFWLKRTLVSSTEGAVSRLNDEIASAKAKETELNKKLDEAEEELKKRLMEAREVATKLRTEAEEETKSERDKIITKAREESEVIIEKAQGAKDKIKLELEKENDIRMIQHSMEVLNKILSDKAKGALDVTLIDEFLENLKNTDMSRISSDIKEAQIISVHPIPQDKLTQLTSIIKEKMEREIVIKTSTDAQIGGGVIVKFGTMALDGSIKNLIREAGTEMVAVTEARVG